MTERAASERVVPVMDAQAEIVEAWRAREAAFWQAMQAERDAEVGEPECTEPECGAWH
jgi:hypothetical protein